ncbi:hypothetical protein MANES_01G254904v8 [Manihot esculenta]|uniref:Uncharacterized protein n=1 Tax=Manihot esculenta TaxID=3983 RepID=A0ACB7IJZ3_MANES|nr:hypothetical protein MANES_01G254904v8 [Manihot esculenta]
MEGGFLETVAIFNHLQNSVILHFNFVYMYYILLVQRLFCRLVS